MKKTELYTKAMNVWGPNSQCRMVLEEMAELSHVLLKFWRDPNFETIKQIREEIADVEIMIEQIRIIFDSSEIEKIRSEKLKRLHRRLNGEKI